MLKKLRIENFSIRVNQKDQKRPLQFLKNLGGRIFLLAIHRKKSPR